MCEEIELYLDDAETRMNKTIRVLKQDLNKVRTGRARCPMSTHQTPLQL